eukprot:CAMPEP_0171625144 /NCGR_PEP_ID=MMETSP0990-20121206/19122_1 /TAXON_ID=483369 /ORGANISM="non described non described, Strain CCMP2098" /LENGTH=92 /DNA_ID=CAMNT_0012191993 /DNA_START=198 /DNA_END=476 /DNA_ORIENTATION=-
MEPSEQNIFVNVTVHDKEITISCGVGTQKVKWLGIVAISRYDEELYQGWKVLGVPMHCEKIETGESLNMNQTINECLRNGDRIKVETSMDPK